MAEKTERTLFDQIVNGIHVREMENPPDLVDMASVGDFFFCRKFASEFRLRRVVCEKIAAAEKRLPVNCRFILFEAFRPRQRQIELWDDIMLKLRGQHPDWSEEQYRIEAERFVANPHGFGSGHQAGAAVDISLCSETGQPYFMGTEVQEFNAKTKSENHLINEQEASFRKLLRDALEAEGIINYPEEWWHFSYGDRLWAEVTSRDQAFFAPID